MAKIRASCPGCEATLSLDAGRAGKKIRCPRCETVFTPQLESADEGFEVVEPAPKPALRKNKQFRRKRQGAPAGALVAMIVGGVVLAGGLGAGGYLLLKKKGGGGGAVHKDVVPPEGIGINVGQLAKEIAGEDIHGTAFKLSDYRGKVVLLDFWGHW